MASLLEETLFEISGQGPAPNKDYFHLKISKTEVIWRWWKISLRTECRNMRPGEVRESHSDYLDDNRLQSQVSVVFGPRILQHTKALCAGQIDYLERLPNSLLFTIMNYLELEDITKLGCTSRRFRKLCSSEEFWEQMVRVRFDTVPAGVEAIAQELGWRSVFFTNKLQLQKQIRRRTHRTTEQLDLKNNTVSHLDSTKLSEYGQGEWRAECENGFK
ncbi:F-box only protein 36b [Chanos chanos]|uniref:F-box only protein 36b n=1 Tax=Chanos chanos TaxID=29144 RepID=A0A6J2VCQ5_CHACN|nr:F-box only protein 36-like [Chanos chanos]